MGASCCSYNVTEGGACKASAGSTFPRTDVVIYGVDLVVATTCNPGYSLFHGGCIPTVGQPVTTSDFAQMTSGAMAGSQLDAPSLIYPGGSYSLGTNWNCGQPAGGLSQTLVSGSLDHPYGSIAWVKPTCSFNSSGYCMDAAAGEYPAFTKFGPGLSDAAYLWFVDSYWPAPGTTAEVLGFIHEETIGHVPDNDQLGLAWSEDNGNTWKYLGRIISGNSGSNSGIGNIEGAPFIIMNGYFYVYFTDTPGWTAVARASVSDVISSARAGTLASWTKYDAGATNPWSEPGLRGQSSALGGISGGITHTQAVHSAVTGKYYLPTTMHKYYGNPTWVNLYESTDGINWTLLSNVVYEDATNSTQIGGYQYCSLTDVTGAANHEVGQQFYLYCSRYAEPPSPTSCASSVDQYRWTITLNAH